MGRCLGVTRLPVAIPFRYLSGGHVQSAPDRYKNKVTVRTCLCTRRKAIAKVAPKVSKHTHAFDTHMDSGVRRGVVRECAK